MTLKKDSTYLIIPATYNPSDLSDYSLRIFSTLKVTFEENISEMKEIQRFVGRFVNLGKFGRRVDKGNSTLENQISRSNSKTISQEYIVRAEEKAKLCIHLSTQVEDIEIQIELLT